MRYCGVVKRPYHGIAICRAKTGDRLYVVPRAKLREKGRFYLDEMLENLLDGERGRMGIPKGEG